MTRPGGSDGYILVAVLGVMLVLTGLIVSSSMVAGSALRDARVDDAAAVLDGLLRAGLEATAYQIFTLKLPLAAVSGRPLHVERGTVEVHLTDEAGKIDVNGSDPAVLIGALRAIDMDAGTAASLAARVTALRGPKAQADDPSPVTTPDPVTPQPSAAADPPLSGATSTPPRHTGYRSVAEFIEVAGLDQREAATLSPMLTIANPDGKVDVVTASRRVLMALPGMSDALADSLLADRSSTSKVDMDRLRSTLSGQSAYVKFETGPCYRATLVATLDSGQTASASALVAASKSTGDPFYVLDWEAP